MSSKHSEPNSNSDEVDRAQESGEQPSNSPLTQTTTSDKRPGSSAEAARAYRKQMESKKNPEKAGPYLHWPSKVSVTETIWGFLGVIAAMNDSLARTSINFLSCNLIFWILLFFVVYHAVLNASQSFHNTGFVIGLLWLLISIPISLTILGGMIAIGIRNTVFHKKGNLLIAPPTDNEAGVEPLVPTDVKVTGNFWLEEQQIERFVCMPSNLRITNIGSLCAYTNIDASTKFSGFTIAKREGLWTVNIYPWLIKEVEVGTQYWGSGSYPSVRLRHDKDLRTDDDFDDIDYDTKVIRVLA